MTAPYEIVILDVGGAALTIPFERAGQADPEIVGGLSRAYGGNQYSSIVAEYMVIPLVSAPVSSAIYAQTKAMFALGAQVPCAQGSAGNVFEGVTGVVTCSGKVTGEMIPGGVDDDGKPLWTMSVILTEVGSALTAGAAPYEFLLTSVTSPDLGTALVSTPDGSYPGDFGSGTTLGAAAVLDTSVCPTAPDIWYSPSPEISWLSVPLEAGYLVGAPVVRAEFGGVNPAVWAFASVRGVLSLYRASSVVDGPWYSGYVGNFGLLGAITNYLTWADVLSFPLESGDQLLLDLECRLQLQCGQADDAARPFIYHGAVPGPRQNPVLFVSGTIASL